MNLPVPKIEPKACVFLAKGVTHKATVADKNCKTSSIKNSGGYCDQFHRKRMRDT